MRLTCPNCGADYEVSDGMIPPAGRHVQCTACHTRWFVRGASGPGLTEDQILRRLESWSPRPRPVPVPTAAGAEAEPRPEPRREAAAAAPVVVPLPPRPAAPAKPADRPAVTRPAPLSAPGRLQPSPRLDLGEPAPPPVATPPPPSRSRLVHGFLLALVLAAFALGAYLYRGPIAARVPPAATALAAYGAAVDRWREEIENRLGRFRSDPDLGQDSPGA